MRLQEVRRRELSHVYRTVQVLLGAGVFCVVQKLERQPSEGQHFGVALVVHAIRLVESTPDEPNDCEISFTLEAGAGPLQADTLRLLLRRQQRGLLQFNEALGKSGHLRQQLILQQG